MPSPSTNSDTMCMGMLCSSVKCCLSLSYSLKTRAHELRQNTNKFSVKNITASCSSVQMQCVMYLPAFELAVYFHVQWRNVVGALHVPYRKKKTIQDGLCTKIISMPALVYMLIFVCACVHLYVCVYVYIHTHTCTYIYMHSHTKTYVCMRTHTHTCTQIPPPAFRQTWISCLRCKLTWLLFAPACDVMKMSIFIFACC